MAAAVNAQRASDAEALERLVAAARTCFARAGVGKTRIAAIASEAGMVRQTVYAFVSSREELIELAFVARLRELVPTIVARLEPGPSDLVSAIVECFAVMAEVASADREFIEYADALGLERALQFLTGPYAPHSLVIEIVRPYYARAAAEGILRHGISLDDMAWWPRNVLAPLVVRTDVDGAQLRALLRRFALPALVSVDDA
jgi:AcrR family transcriptional regulator